MVADCFEESSRRKSADSSFHDKRGKEKGSLPRLPPLGRTTESREKNHFRSPLIDTGWRQWNVNIEPSETTGSRGTCVTWYRRKTGPSVAVFVRGRRTTMTTSLSIKARLSFLLFFYENSCYLKTFPNEPVRCFAQNHSRTVHTNKEIKGARCFLQPYAG